MVSRNHSTLSSFFFSCELNTHYNNLYIWWRNLVMKYFFIVQYKSWAMKYKLRRYSVKHRLHYGTECIYIIDFSEWSKKSLVKLNVYIIDFSEPASWSPLCGECHFCFWYQAYGPWPLSPREIEMCDVESKPFSHATITQKQKLDYLPHTPNTHTK